MSESALTAKDPVIHAYWIHKKIKEPTAVAGYFFERACTCSHCNKQVNMEKKKCPYCGAIMDKETL